MLLPEHRTDTRLKTRDGAIGRQQCAGIQRTPSGKPGSIQGSTDTTCFHRAYTLIILKPRSTSKLERHVFDDQITYKLPSRTRVRCIPHSSGLARFSRKLERYNLGLVSCRGFDAS